MFKTILISFVAAGAAWAADAPSVDAIFQKHIDATGGIKNYLKVKTMRSEGAVEIAGQGIKGSIAISRALPDKSLTAMNLAGLGMIRSGSSGDEAWQDSTMQGPRWIEGEEKEQTLRLSRMDAMLNWHATYGEVRIDGEEDIDGKACWRLVAQPPKMSKPETLWFEKASGLLTKTSFTAVTAMGSMPVESRFLDYRDAGGIKVAYKLVQSLGPQKIETVLSEVKLNAELKPTEFDPPAELVAAAKKQ